MKILFAADVHADPNAGAAGTEYQTIGALRRLGHEVDAVWRDDLPHRIRHGNLHYLLELPRAYETLVLRRCANCTYDVIHINQPHCYRAARSHRIKKLPGVVVHRSHGLELRYNEALDYWRKQWNQREKNWPYNWMSLGLRRALDRHCHLAARYCDGTIVSCSQCRDYLIQRQQVSGARIAVIPQAAPPSYLETAVKPASAARQRRLLYVGQFAFFKAPQILAAAFRQLAERYKDITLTWVCQPSHHKSAREMLGPVANRCNFLAWMSQDELCEVYDTHGIFLFPSIWEGFGKTFLEAMSRGLAVIASDEGGMRDLIQDDQNGLLVPAGNSELLALRTSELLDSIPKYEQVSHRARDTALKHTWGRVATQTTAFYETLINIKECRLKSTAMACH